ncbi:MAG: aquaporin [Cyanobacteria bacterium J06623_1]
MKLEHWREYLIEAWGLGIFMIMAGVFATLLYSPKSIVSQMISNDLLQRLLMGIATGVTAIIIIYSPWGKRSGAHINPAVTITFWRLQKISSLDAIAYIVAQFIGGVSGVFLVRLVLGSPFTSPPISYAVTIPGHLGLFPALVVEFLLSFFLMFMVLITSNHYRLSRYTGVFAGTLVATFVAFEAPMWGTSINPARTFATALAAQIWDGFWIYYFAPPLAMLTAAELYLHYPKKPKVICCKLCPNHEQDCIAINCCATVL